MRDAVGHRRVLLGIAVLAIACVLGPAGSASAAVTHVFQSGFEVPAYGVRGVAVDEESGSVYVITEYPGTVQKFTAAGVPSNFSGTGSNTIELPETPRSIAVDNSGGVNQGVLYMGTEQNYAYVYTPAGVFSARFKKGSLSETFPNNTGPYCGVAVDSGGNWLISHAYGFIQEPYIDKFHPGLWIGNASPEQVWPIAGTMVGLQQNTCKIAVDTENAIYTNSSFATGTGVLRKYPASVFSLEKPPSQVIDQSSTAHSIDTSTNDVYSDRNSSIARFDSGGVLRESFATGEFEESAGVAVNSNDSTVYAVVRWAGGLEKKEVRIYKGVITPDISDVEADAGQTSADLEALIGTAAAGNVTDCEVEYGTSELYGSSANCAPDASGTPYSGPQQVTAALAGLAKETTYHFRFRATNANGANKDVDGTFTTHNVRNLQTEDPTAVTRTEATLNASFEGDGDPTSYKFEYGPNPGYGQTIEGASPSSATGPVTVSETIEGLETYLPSGEGTYHYRVVATNSSGTTVGPDVVFHTSPPDLPEISGTESSEVTTESALISAAINPGDGKTVFSVDYGTDTEYGLSSPVSDSIGDDEAEHPVSTTLSGLTPGVTYHYRVVAVNFGGTTHGPDHSFTTVALPEPEIPKEPEKPAQTPTPTPTPEPKPTKCKKGFVKKKGKCVKKHKKKHKKKHNKRRRGANQ